MAQERGLLLGAGSTYSMSGIPGRRLEDPCGPDRPEQLVSIWCRMLGPNGTAITYLRVNVYNDIVASVRHLADLL